MQDSNYQKTDLFKINKLDRFNFIYLIAEV